MCGIQADSKASPPRPIGWTSPRILPWLGCLLFLGNWGLGAKHWPSANARGALIAKEYYYLTARTGSRHQPVVYVSSVVGPISVPDAKLVEASFLRALPTHPHRLQMEHLVQQAALIDRRNTFIQTQAKTSRIIFLR